MKLKTTHQTAPSKQRKLRMPSMKTLLPWLIIVGVIAVVLGAAGIYTWLTADGREVRNFVYNTQNGSYTDPETGITYMPAPFCFESVLSASEDYPYAVNDEGHHSLFQIGYRDEKDQVHLKQGSAWLSTAKSVGGQLYYNPDQVRIPTYAEFDWDKIYFSNPDAGQFSVYTMSPGDADRLMQVFISEESENLFATHYDTDKLESKLTLRVSSNTYKWLYLNLTVFADEEGNFYITQQGALIADDPRMVAVDKAFFEDYFKSIEDLVNGGQS